MTRALEITDELHERIEHHLTDHESHEASIEELPSAYETEGAFLRESSSERAFPGPNTPSGADSGARSNERNICRHS
jgi:hypothetical protein